jgi:hypothetical protein
VLGLLLVSVVAVTGCADSATKARPRSSPDSPSPRPSPRTTPPEDICTRLVAHWSREVLVGEGYGDYQSMGLSNGQYAILMEVVEAARAEKKRDGRAAAEELIDSRSRELCAERYRNGTPTGGPWQ